MSVRDPVPKANLEKGLHGIYGEGFLTITPTSTEGVLSAFRLEACPPRLQVGESDLVERLGHESEKVFYCSRISRPRISGGL